MLEVCFLYRQDFNYILLGSTGVETSQVLRIFHVHCTFLSIEMIEVPEAKVPERKNSYHCFRNCSVFCCCLFEVVTSSIPRSYAMMAKIEVRLLAQSTEITQSKYVMSLISSHDTILNCLLQNSGSRLNFHCNEKS